MHATNRLRALALLGFLLGVGGCSRSDHPLATVRGTVTFDGGACPAPGRVIFQPQSATDGAPRRPGRGLFTEDGQFEATTFVEGDGLLPGTYLVEVQCDKGQPDMRSADPFGDISFVAPGYKPQEIVVQAGTPIADLEIDVPRRK
jgi:hypothetical protein